MDLKQAPTPWNVGPRKHRDPGPALAGAGGAGIGPPLKRSPCWAGPGGKKPGDGAPHKFLRIVASEVELRPPPIFGIHYVLFEKVDRHDLRITIAFKLTIVTAGFRRSCSCHCMRAHSTPIALLMIEPLTLTICSFVVSFFTLHFLLQRPCFYCSALLIILFCSSCSWANSCFFDPDGNFFEPRLFSSPLAPSTSESNSCSNRSSTGSKEIHDSEIPFLVASINETASALASVAVSGMKRRIQSKTDWAESCVGWAKRLSEWRFQLPCLDVQVRL